MGELLKPITTVVTPAITRDLISLANLKVDLGIVGTADDVFLQRAISRASAIVETFCDRIFPLETVQDRFLHPNGNLLQLSRWPVASLTSITGTLVENTDYQVDRQAGWIVSLGGAWGSNEVTVVYQGGFGLIPLEIQAAVGELVKTAQFSRSRDPLLKSENILSGLYAYTLSDGNSGGAGTAKQVEMLLQPYRRMVV